MRLPKQLWGEIISYENLAPSSPRVTLANGRRHKGEGALFQSNLDQHLHRLRSDLQNRSYRHGSNRVPFAVNEPKQRLILAAPIRDRVVHHALHDVIAPIIDRGFIPTWRTLFLLSICSMSKSGSRF